MLVKLLILLLLTYTSSGNVTKCCKTGKNELIRGKCEDGSLRMKLDCNQSFLLPANNKDLPITEGADGNIFVGTQSFEPNMYCQITRNSTVYYSVCYIEDTVHETTSKITTVLAFISAFFIILTIAVYFIVPNLLDLQGICTIHSIAGLATAFFFLGLMNVILDSSQEVCEGIGYMLYFSFLYAFFWLNMLSFHIWRTTINPQIFKEFSNWQTLYHIYGISLPVLFLIIVISCNKSTYPGDYHPGIGQASCWFESLSLSFIYFYIPIGILLSINITFYIWVIIFLWKQINLLDVKKAKILKYRAKLCLKLFFIMGITWIFEILSAYCEHINSDSKFIWITTDILNGIQGILIFLILVVFRKKVIRGLANRSVCGIRMPRRWRQVEDSECEEEEEEINLSDNNTNGITVQNKA